MTHTIGYRSELQYGDLVHLRAREYDPDTGLFLSPDPLDGVDGTTTVNNPYHYTDNDPINSADPLGLRPTDRDAGGGGQTQCQTHPQVTLDPSEGPSPTRETYLMAPLRAISCNMRGIDLGVPAAFSGVTVTRIPKALDGSDCVDVRDALQTRIGDIAKRFIDVYFNLGENGGPPLPMEGSKDSVASHLAQYQIRQGQLLQTVAYSWDHNCSDLYPELEAMEEMALTVGTWDEPEPQQLPESSLSIDLPSINLPSIDLSSANSLWVSNGGSDQMNWAIPAAVTLVLIAVMVIAVA